MTTTSSSHHDIPRVALLPPPPRRTAGERARLVLHVGLVVALVVAALALAFLVLSVRVAYGRAAERRVLDPLDPVAGLPAPAP